MTKIQNTIYGLLCAFAFLPLGLQADEEENILAEEYYIPKYYEASEQIIASIQEEENYIPKQYGVDEEHIIASIQEEENILVEENYIPKHHEADEEHIIAYVQEDKIDHNLSYKEDKGCPCQDNHRGKNIA